MRLQIETMWCNSCQENTGHLQGSLDHVLHFIGFLFTGGLWVIGWAVSWATWKERPWHCMGCGHVYTLPLKRTAQEEP